MPYLDFLVDTFQWVSPTKFFRIPYFPHLSQLPFKIYSYKTIFLGHAVAQLVEALRYKPEGSGFESQ
jgi:hypothetical protein